MKMFLTIFAIFSLSSHANALLKAQSNSKAQQVKIEREGLEQTPEALFKRYKAAIVKILIRQQSIPVSQGTGFFISQTGEMVTNFHVLKDVLKRGSFTAEFILSDGQILRDVQLGKCKDARELDLCVLRLAVKPSSWFNLQAVEPLPGEAVYVIGHPEGLDYSITNGIVSGLRLTSSKIREVQVSAAINPGNSGGPIFNKSGKLLAIASKFLRDNQNLSFGIHSAEIGSFIQGPINWISLSDYKKNVEINAINLANKWIKGLISPAWVKLKNGDPLDPEQFRSVKFEFGKDSFWAYLPKIFEPCKQKDIGKKRYITCNTADNSASLLVGKFPAAQSSINKMHGKKIIPRKPIALVQNLMKEGLWTDLAKSLNQNDKENLFSNPSPAQCGKVRENLTVNALFPTGTSECFFTIQHDQQTDALSLETWLQRDGFIYSFSLWLEDASYSEFFAQITPLIVHTSKWSEELLSAKSGEDLPSANFSIQVDPKYHLTKAQKLQHGINSFIYSPQKNCSQPNGSPVFMVNFTKENTIRKDLSQAATGILLGLVEGMHGAIDLHQVRSHRIDIDGMKGLSQTGTFKRDNEKMFIYHATLPSPRGTYMLVGMSPLSSSPRDLADFEKMTASLRQK